MAEVSNSDLRLMLTTLELVIISHLYTDSHKLIC